MVAYSAEANNCDMHDLMRVLSAMVFADLISMKVIGSIRPVFSQ